MALELTRITTLAGGLDHPEGVAFGPDGNVYATGEAGQVYRIHLPDKRLEQFASTGGFGLGIAIDADSNLYICDMGVHAVVRVFPDGRTERYATGSEEEPLQVPNYPVFDAEGTLYVSDSGGWTQKTGKIYRFRPGEVGEVWCRTAADYTNGMAFSPDDRWLYVVESCLPGVSRVAIRSDGSAGEREIVVRMPDTVPDGIAFDVDGGLYITCYAPDRIYFLPPGGQLEIVFDDWQRSLLNAPCNIAFAGSDLSRLAISALGGWAINWADVGACGLPVHHPRL
jgi:gluconolactonase